MNTTQAIERARDVIRRQHKAWATEESYISWLRRYMAALPKMPNGLSSEQKIERFLTDLAYQGISASSQNQAFNAVLFFYKAVLGQTIGNVDALRAQRAGHMRHAPSMRDTQRLIQTVRNVGGYLTNLIVRMLHGCGMRVTEPLNLRIKDINLERGRACDGLPSVARSVA
jgi:site-specific recombinase XerD